MSECATRPRGERVLECTASGALVTVEPRVAQALAQLGGSRELAVRGVARSGQVGGGGRCPPWGGVVRSGAAPDRQAGGRSSRRSGRRRSLHHGVPGAPWRRRRVLPRRGKCRARAPQPRCSWARGRHGRSGGGAARGIPVPDAPRAYAWPLMPILGPTAFFFPYLPRGSLGTTGGWLRPGKPTR